VNTTSKKTFDRTKINNSSKTRKETNKNGGKINKNGKETNKNGGKTNKNGKETNKNNGLTLN
jgi:hypothetical protein